MHNQIIYCTNVFIIEHFDLNILLNLFSIDTQRWSSYFQLLLKSRMWSLWYKSWTQSVKMGSWQSLGHVPMAFLSCSPTVPKWWAGFSPLHAHFHRSLRCPLPCSNFHSSTAMTNFMALPSFDLGCAWLLEFVLNFLVFIRCLYTMF